MVVAESDRASGLSIPAVAAVALLMGSCVDTKTPLLQETGPTGTDAPSDTDSDTATDVDMAGMDVGLEGGGDGGGADAGDGKLVCVFDIDATLTCSFAVAAVSACKDLGALLAVNTAESRSVALSNMAGTGYVDWDALGFPTNGEAVDMEHGAFIFGLCEEDCSCSEEFGGDPGDCDMCSDCGPSCPDPYMGKAYGMMRIAEHYGVTDKTCLVLLDDLSTNTAKVEQFGYSALYHGPCSAGWDSTGTYDAVHDFLVSGELDHCFGVPRAMDSLFFPEL
jgi:hypothetical protein